MIVLTGATGFLGMELLVRILEQTDREVVTLVRASDQAAADARVAKVLDAVLPPEVVPAVAGRVRALPADLEAPRLGLSPRDHDELAGRAHTVVHCAASVQFTLPREEAWRINVGGTRAMLELAGAAPTLDRFVHVSTAYVAGERAGVCREDEGDVGQTHRNTYEASKLAAEAVVADCGLPHCTLRPSIVVGDSRTGWTPAFNVIYWPLQAFSRGLFARVPAPRDALLDVVPIDHVADALLALSVGRRRDGTFHAVAGAHVSHAGEIVELAARAFDRPEPQFVAPGTAPEVAEVAGAFLPYFTTRTTFDATRGRELAAAPPPLREYFGVLMDHARAARWGKRDISRWQAVATSRLAA